MPIDGLYFNSGIILLSKALAGAYKLPKPHSIESLLGDQAWFNAMRHLYQWPIYDLGYSFNFVGSFEGDNLSKRPLENSTDAFCIHATTGLPDNSVRGRLLYLNDIHESWQVRGI